MISGLEACPFCGDSLQVGKLSMRESPVCGGRYYTIECLECGAEGPACDTPEKARAAWSRRPGAQAARERGRRDERLHIFETVRKHDWFAVTEARVIDELDPLPAAHPTDEAPGKGRG